MIRSLLVAIPAAVAVALGVGSDTPPARSPHAPALETAVFAGGCFWGVEAVFEHVKGVRDVVSGYAGGTASTADYPTVSTGRTGHAESVMISYDPTVVSYETLLEVFFEVAHDPTELNRQGPDVGPQYRSAIFYANDAQRAKARAFIDSLGKSGRFAKPIVTQVAPLENFFRAEAYHQDYLESHRTQPYIVIHDLPKLDALEKRYPQLWRKPR